MSYYNHRNYQMDSPNRRAAQVAQNNWTHAQHQQQRAINRVSRDYLSGGANAVAWPNHTSWRNLHIAEAAQPYGEQMENFHNQRMHAMQNYMDNEMAQVQDRMADMGENRISSKNRSDEMAAGIKNREVDAQIAALAAGERMNQANNNSLTAIGDSLNAPALNSEQMPVPGINGFDSNGKKVWGTYFTG